MSVSIANQFQPDREYFLEAPMLTGEELWIQRDYNGPITWEMFDASGVERNLAVAILTLRSMPYERYLQTTHWAGIRKRTRETTNGQCRICCANMRDCHHVTYLRKGFERLNDVIPVCGGCHDTQTKSIRAMIRESLQ